MAVETDRIDGGARRQRQPASGSAAEQAEIAVLAERIQTGEPKLAAVFYIRCLGRARDWARELLGDPYEAQDLAQQVLVRAIDALHAARLEDPQRVLPWLSAMTRNAAFDHLRKHARVDVLEPDVIAHLREEVAGPVALGSTRWLADNDLAAALGCLSELERQVVVLRYRRDLSLGGIAAALGRREDAIRQAHIRALARLRVRVGPRERASAGRERLAARGLRFEARRLLAHSFSVLRA